MHDDPVLPVGDDGDSRDRGGALELEMPRIDYARYAYRWRQHHARYERHVKNMPRKLVCQECKGYGGERLVLLDDGSGPWEECGWCEGVGLLTPYRRGQWLAYCREAARKTRITGLGK